MPENQSREPLLYIQQPDFTYPELEMQQTYIVKTAKPNREKSPIAPLTELDSESETIMNQTDQVKENEVEKAVEEVKQVKAVEQQANKDISADQSPQKQELDQKVVQEVINQYHNQTQESDDSRGTSRGKQHSYTFKRVKSFKEMNTLEKLNYLEHFPKLLPPVPCIFATGSSSVRGFLLNKTEDSVELRLFNDKIMQIPIEQITEVKMLGLQS